MPPVAGPVGTPPEAQNPPVVGQFVPEGNFMDTKDIEAYVTDRLVTFYNALLERGQINPPLSGCNPLVHTPQIALPEDRAPQTSGQLPLS